MEDYNTFITENNYKREYSFLTEKMFVIKGSYKVKYLIKENREKKKKGIKKKPNNEILKIGNIGPETFARILDNLLTIIKLILMLFLREGRRLYMQGTQVVRMSI